MIFSIFTAIEAKKSTNRRDDRKKRKLPTPSVARSSPQLTTHVPKMSKADSTPLLKVSSNNNEKNNQHVNTHHVKSSPITSNNLSEVVQGPVPVRRGIIHRTLNFPVWLPSYVIVMKTEECPKNNGELQFAQKDRGVCVMICDRAHCIQTRTHCCYYAEPEKLSQLAMK